MPSAGCASIRVTRSVIRAVIPDPKEARLLGLNRRFRVISRRSMRARKLRRFYRLIKLPALIAALCGIALGFMLAMI